MLRSLFYFASVRPQKLPVEMRYITYRNDAKSILAAFLASSLVKGCLFLVPNDAFQRFFAKKCFSRFSHREDLLRLALSLRKSHRLGRGMLSYLNLFVFTSGTSC